MRTKKITLASILSIALSVSCGEALASSGNPITHLPWKPGTEILEYYSCGAADYCWAAKVKNRKTKKQIAMLRCDSEKLFSSVGRHRETIAAEDCHRFENDNKFQEIPAALRELLHR